MSHYTVINEPASPLISLFKSLGFYRQKKKYLREAVGLHAVCRYAQNEDKTNTKEAVTLCVPSIPNPSTPESVPATPSSELRSKCERMAQRFAQRESWPPQSLLRPWTKVLLRARHIHWKLILCSVPKLSFTLDLLSCFVDIPLGSHRTYSVSCIKTI